MMRLVLVALAAATIGALAAPGVSEAQLPVQDSVTGFAATGEGRLSVDFTFDARSGPSGENPGGTVSFDAFLIDLGALHVSCLSVSGNRASMIVLIPPISAAPAGILISVEDNDGAGEDRLAWTFLTTLPTGCPVPSSIGGPIQAGDITVTDAQPFPTTADQCKHGGWHAFGFANEGECIAFVNHAQDCRILEQHGDHPHFCPPRPPAPPHE